MEGGGRGVCHGMLVPTEVNEGSAQEDDASVGEGQQNAKLLAEKRKDIDGIIHINFESLAPLFW